MTQTLFAEDSSQEGLETIVQQANESYTTGDFEAARKLYLRAIKAGANNGHIYFNYANTLYRLQLFGKAIAYYRRALLDLPNNPDILANLTLARKQAVDKLEEQGPESGNAFSISRVLDYHPALNKNQMKILFVSIYCLAWLSLFWYYKTRRDSTKPITYALFILAIICASSVWGLEYGRKGNLVFAFSLESGGYSPAVVSTKQANVYSGNSTNFQVIFKLNEGAEVLIGERRGDWAEVLLPQGRKGWLELRNVITI